MSENQPNTYVVTSDSFRLYLELMSRSSPPPSITRAPMAGKWFSQREQAAYDYLYQLFWQNGDAWATAREIAFATGIISHERDSVPGTFSTLLTNLVDRDVLESSQRHGFRLSEPERVALLQRHSERNSEQCAGSSGTVDLG